MSQIILSDLQLCSLCRSFALMLHAGISLADIAFLLAEDSDCRDLMEALGTHLDEGNLLSKAMEETGCFPKQVTGMIRIGEQTGRLEESLSSLADYYEEQHRIRRRIYAAITYPSMLLILMLLVIGVLLVKVLPVFDNVYASLGSRLTGIAGGLLKLGYGLQKLLPVFLVLLSITAIAVVILALCHSIRGKCTAFLSRRFGDRGVSRKYNNAHFARAMAMGLSSGLTLEETLRLASLLLDHIPSAANRCRQCAEALSSGASLAYAMSNAELLDAAACRLLSVGLRGGNGDRVMAKIADDLAEEASLSLERSISRIEPTLVLAASFLVGAILLTVMLPLMNILSTLG